MRRPKYKIGDKVDYKMWGTWRKNGTVVKAEKGNDYSYLYMVKEPSGLWFDFTTRDLRFALDGFVIDL
jgi:hypothetical protein